MVKERYVSKEYPIRHYAWKTYCTDNSKHWPDSLESIRYPKINTLSLSSLFNKAAAGIQRNNSGEKLTISKDLALDILNKVNDNGVGGLGVLHLKIYTAINNYKNDFKQYFDDINIVMDFSGVKDQKILTKIQDQLINLKKYLPSLHAKINELAHQAVLEHGSITIAFNNCQKELGSYANWYKATKTINIDYAVEHMALIQAMGFELCNANNKKLNSFYEDILTTQYIYSNNKSLIEESKKLAIKCLETEYLSHIELKKIFDSYLVRDSNGTKTREEATIETINYYTHYNMSVDNIIKCISRLSLKGGDVEPFVNAHPGHVEIYQMQAIHFILKNVNKHHQDILNSLEYSLAAEKKESFFLDKKSVFENLFSFKQLSKTDLSYSVGYQIAERKHVPTKRKEISYSMKMQINFLISWLEERSQDGEITDKWYATNSSSSSDCIELCDADSLSLQAIGDSYQDHL